MKCDGVAQSCEAGRVWVVGRDSDEACNRGCCGMRNKLKFVQIKIRGGGRNAKLLRLWARKFGKSKNNTREKSTR
jgi:hypothetical protein